MRRCEGCPLCRGWHRAARPRRRRSQAGPTTVRIDDDVGAERAEQLVREWLDELLREPMT